MASNPVQAIIDKILSFLHGLKGSKKEAAIRRPPTKSEAVVPEAETSAPGQVATPQAPINPSPRATQSRMVPLNEKRPVGKDQWRKIKETAKDSDAAETNIEHWNQGKAPIAGTSFTPNSDTESKRKRPAIVTQARITSNRLQALQTRLEKPTNEIDKSDHDDESGVPRGH
jgi:hypothetical protein